MKNALEYIMGITKIFLINFINILIDCKDIHVLLSSLTFSDCPSQKF